MKLSLQEPEILTMEFEHPVEAAVMDKTIFGELRPRERQAFYSDIVASREDPERNITIHILSERARNAVINHLTERAERFGPQSHVDYDESPIDYDPTNTNLEHRVEAQLVTIFRDQLRGFFFPSEE